MSPARKKTKRNPPTPRPGEKLSAASARRHEAQAERRAAEFLKGPVPLPWLIEAARLPGKSPLAVGIALWFRAGATKRREGVALNPATLARFGLNRMAGWRGLEALEAAELVTVERHHGRAPLVTIREVDCIAGLTAL